MDTTALQSADNNLNYIFNWFDTKLKSAVLHALEAFWENKYLIKTESLTTNSSVKEDFISKGEMYFTAQLPVSGKQNSYIRLSSEFIRILFHETFGSNSPVFKLQDVSELEIKILNSFCEFVNEEIKEMVVAYENIPKNKLKNKGVYNITFFIGKDKSQFGKMVISIPENCLEAQPVELAQNFDDEGFMNVSTFVNILAGTSKLSLNDLKNLYQGDIILLEDSNVSSMKIKTGKIIKSFKINPDPSLMLELDDEEEQELGVEMAENKNIWDDIQIEVGAEFDKVKMTLGDLKQISKGLVIDLGPIFENKVSLFVENKVVAKGELVIINDKYGVRIDEIISNEQQMEEPVQKELPPQQATAPKAAPKAAAKKPAAAKAPDDLVNKMAQQTAKEAVPAGEAEEFDYSDFESEDS